MTARTVVMIAGAGDTLMTFRGPLLYDLVRAGHRVHVLAPGIPADTRRQLESASISCHEIPLRRTGLNPFVDFGTLRAIYRCLRRLRPDTVFSYHIKAVNYGSLAARACGIRDVHSMITGLGYAFIGGNGFRQRVAGFMARALYRLSLRCNRVVFFQNPDDLALFRRRRLIGAGTRTVLVNGSGVDLDYYLPAPLPQEPVFLMIARLLKDKGIHEYVAAAKQVKREYPMARFLLMGWIDENPSAIRQSELEAWKGSGVIEYLGRLEDVRPALRQARVYVLPSYREGTPKTVLEAMAMGRPVVTTDAPGCRETVRNGENGFLVPVRGVDSLVLAMKRFILEPELAVSMGQASRRVAEMRYDVKVVNNVMREAMGL